MQSQLDNLSDFERQVFEAIRSPKSEGHDSQGVSFDEICAETLLTPDIVTKVIAVLARRQLVQIVGETDPSDLQLTVDSGMAL